MSLVATESIVFDAVGTLIYPEPEVAVVYSQVGRQFGSRLSQRKVSARFRAVFEELEVRDRAGELRTSEEFEFARWREIVGRVLDDSADSAGCFAELYAHFARPSSWRVFPDVAPVFEELSSRGVKLALASNFDRRLFEITRQLQPLNLCSHIVVSSQVGYRKPHPEFFAAIAAAIGSAPERIVYVGDDPESDVAGARSVGMRAVLLDRRGQARASAIGSLKELLHDRCDCADY